ncbi:hypothetical protein [Parvularcula dongshanensis]|uniref:Sulfotransferase domain-containing protein n=1 Tax=Parvularcula dongshanensis TaxID=1173995 RepID=A0A840I1L6_9PROT|nr:hypothetical protein [Parvularcula dongshanensis]MBB4658173.1 hypothetical protein [Parvularcula dongshanensis]
MPRVVVKKDNLDERNAEFEQRALTQPVFLNSVPKSGTHLLKNIFRMFVPLEQHYNADFVQIPNLARNMAAFDPAEPKLAWGHLLFADDSAAATAPARHLLLVRDPYDWVLARARFFLSESFQAGLEALRSDRISVEQVLSMMIFGIHNKMPDMRDIFVFNAVAWLGPDVELVRFEELKAAIADLESGASASYFAKLLGCAEADLPADWRARVRIGADRRSSGTARENLKAVAKDVPDVLPPAHQAMVELAVPGVRTMLGYA